MEETSLKDNRIEIVDLLSAKKHLKNQLPKLNSTFKELNEKPKNSDEDSFNKEEIIIDRSSNLIFLPSSFEETTSDVQFNSFSPSLKHQTKFLVPNPYFNSNKTLSQEKTFHCPQSQVGYRHVGPSTLFFDFKKKEIKVISTKETNETNIEIVGIIEKEAICLIRNKTKKLAKMNQNGKTKPLHYFKENIASCNFLGNNFVKMKSYEKESIFNTKTKKILIKKKLVKMIMIHIFIQWDFN